LVQKALKDAKKENAEPPIDVWVDCSQLNPNDFDGLLSLTVSKIVEELKTSRNFSGEPRVAFKNSVKECLTKGPTRIVFDEIDRLVPNFTEDHQAFLRLQTCDADRLNFIFITRAHPYLVVEDSTVQTSRLLGVCQVEQVTGLKRDDVDQLFLRVATDLEWNEFSECSAEVWSAVGGHSVAVSELAHHLAIQRKVNGALSEEDARRAIDDRSDSMLSRLGSFWRDLPIQLRREIDGNSQPVKAIRELKTHGFWNEAQKKKQVPRFLKEVAGNEDLVPERNADDSHDIFFEIQDTITNINTQHHRVHGDYAFRNSNRQRGFSIVLRTIENDDGLEKVVKFLYLLVHDSALDDGHDGAWTIKPEENAKLFQSTYGHKAVYALRQVFSHDDSADPQKIKKDKKNEGDIYEKFSRTRTPMSPEDWDAIRLGLLREVLAAVKALEDKMKQQTTNPQ
jgi:hypothetical protein